MTSRLFAAVSLAAAVAGVSVAAGAQSDPPPLPTPSPIVAPTLPPRSGDQRLIDAATSLLTGYLRQQQINAQNTARGSVTYFKRFEMQVRTGSTSYRDVHLHQGTVINPRGASLGTGLLVDVHGTGHPDGSIDADVITVVQ